MRQKVRRRYSIERTKGHQLRTELELWIMIVYVE